MTDAYEDILRLPRPESTRHPRMSPLERAAQFSPFAALTGYEEVLAESGRRTLTRVELQEDAREALDRKQQLLLDMAHLSPELRVRYFRPDDKKEGGCYPTVHGRLKGVDPIERVLILREGLKIPLDAVLELDSPLFSE